MELTFFGYSMWSWSLLTFISACAKAAVLRHVLSSRSTGQMWLEDAARLARNKLLDCSAVEWRQEGEHTKGKCYWPSSLRIKDKIWRIVGRKQVSDISSRNGMLSEPNILDGKSCILCQKKQCGWNEYVAGERLPFLPSVPTAGSCCRTRSWCPSADHALLITIQGKRQKGELSSQEDTEERGNCLFERLFKHSSLSWQQQRLSLFFYPSL